MFVFFNPEIFFTKNHQHFRFTGNSLVLQYPNLHTSFIARATYFYIPALPSSIVWKPILNVCEDSVEKITITVAKLSMFLQRTGVPRFGIGADQKFGLMGPFLHVGAIYVSI